MEHLKQRTPPVVSVTSPAARWAPISPPMRTAGREGSAMEALSSTSLQQQK